MTPDERLPFYNRFWELLPDVLPFPEWTKAWKQAAGKEAWECRATCLKRAWGVRRHMEESLQLLNRTRFSELCKTLRANRSGCGYGSKGKTCRRRRRGPGS
jgi:hypothetical protein